MKYRILGRSGLRVSELSLGCMTFGKEWGEFGADKNDSEKIFKQYVDLGGNFIDTANKYLEGTSEKFVGEFMGSNREEFVLATKYTITMNPKDLNASGNHRKNMMQSVNASLKRLNTDYIDLLWVHLWDQVTPIEELMRGLDDLVRMGKVFYVGFSDAPAWVIARANTMAEDFGWTPFIAIQIQYSLVQRTVERELIPMAKALDLGVLAWGPLGGGVLTGKYFKKDNSIKRLKPDGNFTGSYLDERNVPIVKEVLTIAEEIYRSPSQVALNWLRHQQHRGVIIPILGARTEDQMKDNLGCLEFELTKEQLHRLDKVSAVDLGFPTEMLNSERGLQFRYGDKYELLENHRK